MPTLKFKGKPFVYSHHLSVPFREKASIETDVIIHGDNLEGVSHSPRPECERNNDMKSKAKYMDVLR